MEVSYNWLTYYCDLKLSPEDLAKFLPELGLQVEGMYHVDGDTVLTLEITANRPDLLSMIGVAREIAAATGSDLLVPAINLKMSGGSAAQKTSVEILAPDLCPRYIARLITGVNIAPSPAWLQKRLQTIGLRPVNNVVDITNFVMMECGQPLHAFNFDKLRGHRIVVRRANTGEQMTVIDGTKQKLSPEMLVIADAEVPVALAGVMGGLDSEISGATTSILLESAEFLPKSIRRTARALGLPSDSSYRFERGVDPQCVEWASRRAAAMIAEIAGGQVLDGSADAGRPVPKEKLVSLRPARANAVLGVTISPEKQLEILTRLGFRVVNELPHEFEIAVPTFRPDVSGEIDLIEELARVFGYNKIPVDTQMKIRAVPEQKIDLVSERTREFLCGVDYHEARTMSFTTVELAARFTHWCAEPNVIRNPVNREEPAMRTSIIPLLLRALKLNRNQGNPPAAMFELAKVYGRRDGKPFEQTCLTFIDERGFLDIRGTVDLLLLHLGICEPLAYEPFGDENLATGRAAKLSLNGRCVGFVGEITGGLKNVFDLRDTPAVAELNFDALVEAANLARRYQQIPRFPSIRRDLCVVVDEAVAWDAIKTSAAGVAGELAESISFQSIYRGKQIPDGRKAVAFSVVFRAKDRTLASEEADSAMARVIGSLERELKAELRQ